MSFRGEVSVGNQITAPFPFLPKDATLGDRDRPIRAVSAITHRESDTRMHQGVEKAAMILRMPRCWEGCRGSAVLALEGL
jgi:hypothetical protein